MEESVQLEFFLKRKKIVIVINMPSGFKNLNFTSSGVNLKALLIGS
jgi:hypothetical protein